MADGHKYVIRGERPSSIHSNGHVPMRLSPAKEFCVLMYGYNNNNRTQLINIPRCYCWLRESVRF